MRSIAIIGCGPAGLLAAHAAVLGDLDPHMYSAEVKPSPNAKAVFLHRPIPDISSRTPDGLISFEKRGTAEGYAQKVYGSRDAPTSWGKFRAGAVPAWALAPAYEALWHLYRGTVRELVADPASVAGLVEDYPLVINTAPAYYLCHANHNFPTRDIWIRDGAQVGVRSNSMVYSGSPLDGWYRSADLFGVESTEFGHPVRNARHGIKVLESDCDCFPEVVRAGRWGTWRPGVLIHHAFEVAALNVANFNAEARR